MGELYLVYPNGIRTYFCDTIENPQIGNKIKGQTAIPTGTYKIKMVNSPRFSGGLGNRKLPELQNVAQFTNILIHMGNSVKDTEGCILVGKNGQNGWITNSKITLIDLLNLCDQYEKRGIEITIQ